MPDAPSGESHSLVRDILSLREQTGETLPVRRVGARTHEALFEAIAQALLTVTAADAHGWFTHCGYPTPMQAEPPSCSEMEELIAQSR